ncbi:MAG: hypothetical protein V3U52_04420 [Thermoplasmata archaeon]
MKFYRVIFIIAGVLLFVGFGFVDRSLDIGPSTLSGEETFAIPIGWESYYVVEVDLQAGGRVSVEFQEISDGAVSVYLFHEQDYASYNAADDVSRAIHSARGPSGVLSVDIPSEGSYFLVFEHARGYEFLSQDVQLSYLFTGLQRDDPDWVFFGIGSALIALGIIAATIAAIRRSLANQGKERATTIRQTSRGA